jgi:hypothetical protein
MERRDRFLQLGGRGEKQGCTGPIPFGIRSVILLQCLSRDRNLILSHSAWIVGNEAIDGTDGFTNSLPSVSRQPDHFNASRPRLIAQAEHVLMADLSAGR